MGVISTALHRKYIGPEGGEGRCEDGAEHPEWSGAGAASKVTPSLDGGWSRAVRMEGMDVTTCSSTVPLLSPWLLACMWIDVQRTPNESCYGFLCPLLLLLLPGLQIILQSILQHPTQYPTEHPPASCTTLQGIPQHPTGYHRASHRASHITRPVFQPLQLSPCCGIPAPASLQGHVVGRKVLSQ